MLFKYNLQDYNRYNNLGDPNHMKKLTLGLACCALLTVGLAGCNKQPASKTVFAESISLDVTEKTLKITETSKEEFTLKATVSPANYNYGTIAWSGGKSSTILDDTQVASVENGKVKALADGETVIYAKINGKDRELTATCTVKVVTDIKLQSVTLEVSSITLAVDEVKEVSYTASPANATERLYVDNESCKTDGVRRVSVTCIGGKVHVMGMAEGTCTLRFIGEDDRQLATLAVTVAPKNA